MERAEAIRADDIENRRVERVAKIAEISRGNAPLGSAERYPVIYADPPWRYENPPIGATNRAIENHYPTMALDEICALPVSDLATEDAVLFLWATATLPPPRAPAKSHPVGDHVARSPQCPCRSMTSPSRDPHPAHTARAASVPSVSAGGLARSSASPQSTGARSQRSQVRRTIHACSRQSATV